MMDTEFLQSLCTGKPYVPATLPVLLLMNTTGTDAWLLDELHGTPQPTKPVLQGVVCADAREADRIFSQWANLKSRQGKVIGGACTVRYDGPETIARERARYGQH